MIGFGEGPHIDKALDELVAKGKIISNDRQRGTIFHYKTDARPPAVSLMDEVKLAVTECLDRMYPNELTRAGIAQKWFNDRYGDPLKGADLRILGRSADSAKVQSALDELVAEGNIDSHEKERDGERMVHYRANKSGSITHYRPTMRLDEKDSTFGQRGQSGQGARDNTPAGVGSAQREVSLAIPEREDAHNEFKETFSVPVSGGKSNDVKMEAVIAVAALANAEGGRLFVGVHDDGKAVGLKKDLKQYKSTDRLESAIRDCLKENLGILPGIELKFSEEDYLVIAVPKHKAGRWVYIGKGLFYVRDGNRSLNLNARETSEYQSMH